MRFIFYFLLVLHLGQAFEKSTNCIVKIISKNLEAAGGEKHPTAWLLEVQKSTPPWPAPVMGREYIVENG
jgi:hypothetical protein